MRLSLLLICLASTTAAGAEYAWKCPDGSIQVTQAKTCPGGQRKNVDDMNATEINAFVKALKAANQTRGLSDEKPRSSASARDTAKVDPCEEAFKGKLEVRNSPWDGSVHAVERFLKSGYLKDPDSFQAIEWGKVVKGCGDYVVSVKYRARNSFGGYAVEARTFTLNADGVVTGSAPYR